jgi:hypothetical protein
MMHPIHIETPKLERRGPDDTVRLAGPQLRISGYPTGLIDADERLDAPVGQGIALGGW